MSSPISRSRLLGFGLGSVGTGVFGAVPGLLLLYYLTDVLGTPTALAGVVLVVPKAWDVLFNPVVGAASDREAVRTGHRTRLLLVGALALPVLFALMFMAPWDSTAGAAWVAVTFLLAATAFACFQVPYVALPAEISPDPAQRTRAMTWRIVCLTVGILVAGGLAPAIVELGGQGRGGYALMGGLIGLVLGASMLVAARRTRWIPSRPGPEPLSLGRALRTARGNRPFFALLGAFVAQSLAVAVMLAGAPYVATYRLDDYGLTSLMFVCMVAPSAFAVPLWAVAARRWGMVRCYLVAVVTFAVTAIALYPAITRGAVVPVLVLTGLIGICYAAVQLVPLSLLPETVRADEARTGHAQSGAFTGVWTAAETAGMAVGPGVFALVLTVTSFTAAPYAATSFTRKATQPESALTGLTAGFTLIPAALMLLSVPMMLAYRRRAASPTKESQHAA
ncbi:MAG: MFS transporter [Streptosporangiaceae bacterium]